MSEVFYRAKLVLDQVEPYQDGNGYHRERTMTIAETVVTGAERADAMAQVLAHAGALYRWHNGPAAAPATETETPA